MAAAVANPPREGWSDALEQELQDIFARDPVARAEHATWRRQFNAKVKRDRADQVAFDARMAAFAAESAAADRRWRLLMDLEDVDLLGGGRPPVDQPAARNPDPFHYTRIRR